MSYTRHNSRSTPSSWKQISPDTDHQLSYSRTLQKHKPSNKTNEEEHYYMRPFELSVDTMQYLVNTNRLFKITENTSQGSKSANWRKEPEINTQQYLSIVDFPSIQIEQSLEIRHTSRHEGFYYDVYEATNVPMLSMPKLLDNFLKGQYYNNLMVRMKDGTEVMRQSVQNVAYVRNAIESIQEPNPAKWKCDLAGIPEKYVFRVEVKDTTGKQHMIVGYPSARTMRQFTDLYEDQAFTDIHDQMKRDSTRRFAELYNYALDKGVASGKITSEKAANDKINLDTPDNLAKDIYKFALGNRPYFYNSIITKYKQLAKEQPNKITVEEAARFESVFNQNTKSYYNALGNRYLNKPITRIRYTFFILESRVATDSYNKAETGLSWIPAVYNIRQLESRHLPILKRIEKLIKLDIPLLFGIISQADYDARLQYELFHSYYKYVNFFHITTEYLHTMSNFTDYAHNLKDSITLEEIIYSVGREAELGRPFWAGLRFDYKIRNYRLDNVVNDNMSNANKRNARRTYTNIEHNTKRNTRRNTRRNIGSRYASRYASRNGSRNINNIVQEPIRNIEILLMYEDTYANYTFIYRILKDGNFSFRKMVLKPNLKALKRVILDGIRFNNQKTKTVYECGNEFIKLLEISRDNIPRNYVIISDEEINYEDLFWKIFLYNPLVARPLYSPGKTPSVNIKYFYKNSLTLNEEEYTLNPLLELDFYNIYLELPVLIQNYIATPIYKTKLDTFNRTGKQLQCTNNIIDEDYTHYKECAETAGILNCVINCVYINPGNCGYNFIEIIDISLSSNSKKTIFVIPYDNDSHSGSSRNSYLGNFLDLRLDHLPMLNKIKGIYERENTSIVLHKVSIMPKYYCLHFHVLKSESQDLIYKKIYPLEERGTFLTQELELNNIINNLSNDGNYYVNYNVSLLTSG